MQHVALTKMERRERVDLPFEWEKHWAAKRQRRSQWSRCDLCSASTCIWPWWTSRARATASPLAARWTAVLPECLAWPAPKPPLAYLSPIPASFFFVFKFTDIKKKKKLEKDNWIWIVDDALHDFLQRQEKEKYFFLCFLGRI